MNKAKRIKLKNSKKYLKKIIKKETMEYMNFL